MQIIQVYYWSLLSVPELTSGFLLCCPVPTRNLQKDPLKSDLLLLNLQTVGSGCAVGKKEEKKKFNPSIMWHNRLKMLNGLFFDILCCLHAMDSREKKAACSWPSWLWNWFRSHCMPFPAPGSWLVAVWCSRCVWEGQSQHPHHRSQNTWYLGGNKSGCGRAPEEETKRSEEKIQKVLFNTSHTLTWSWEYGIPRYWSNPCLVGRNFPFSPYPKCHFPIMAVE